MSALREEKQVLEKQLQEKEGNLAKEIAKLSKKVKSSEKDLKLTKKALKTREDTDSKGKSGIISKALVLLHILHTLQYELKRHVS